METDHIDVIEVLADYDISNVARISFRLVKNRGRLSFQILRLFIKDKWPEDVWMPKKSSPLIILPIFRELKKVMEDYGYRILKLMEEEDEAIKVAEGVKSRNNIESITGETT